MDTIRQYLNRPLVAFLTALLVGLIIGIFILGYWLWPVDWYDSAVSQLRPDLKEEWLRLAIDSYSANLDARLAISRYTQLGADAPEILATVQAGAGAQDAAQIQAFSAIVQAQTGTSAPPSRGGFLSGLLIAFIVLAILIFIGLVAFLAIRLRSKMLPAEEPAPVADLFAAPEPAGEEVALTAAVAEEDLLPYPPAVSAEETLP